VSSSGGNLFHHLRPPDGNRRAWLVAGGVALVAGCVIGWVFEPGTTHSRSDEGMSTIINYSSTVPKTTANPPRPKEVPTKKCFARTPRATPLPEPTNKKSCV
jgi:hypothetical protein